MIQISLARQPATISLIMNPRVLPLHTLAKCQSSNGLVESHWKIMVNMACTYPTKKQMPHLFWFMPSLMPLVWWTQILVRSMVVWHHSFSSFMVAMMNAPGSHFPPIILSSWQTLSDDLVSPPSYTILFNKGTSASIPLYEMALVIPWPLVDIDSPNSQDSFLPPFVCLKTKDTYEHDGQYHKSCLCKTDGVYQFVFKSHVSKHKED